MECRAHHLATVSLSWRAGGVLYLPHVPNKDWGGSPLTLPKLEQSSFLDNRKRWSSIYTKLTWWNCLKLMQLRRRIIIDFIDYNHFVGHTLLSAKECRTLPNPPKRDPSVCFETACRRGACSGRRNAKRCQTSRNVAKPRKRDQSVCFHFQTLSYLLLMKT